MGFVGKDIPHDSARAHVSGQSIYIDDMPPQKNEVLVDFLGSALAKARIVSVDLAEAGKIPGIVGLFTYKDLGGINKFGPVIQDEVLLCEDHASFIGEPIVVIAGETREAINQAKKAIAIHYEELTPVLSIEEAKDKKEFLDRHYLIKRGDCKRALEESAHVLEGTVYIAGQEHFYLESQAALVFPGENNQLVIHTSTQNPTEVQQVAAKVLGLQQNQVVAITKRMGGGFGGKETQGTHPAIMAALVALKLKRPARIIYNKDDDMKFTGKRHAFQNDYQVGFDEDGRITALWADLYANGGAAADLSPSVLGRALTHIDNAYYLPSAEIHGTICKTNFPPTTAFRGFGGPQGIATIEYIMEDIAAYLKKDPFDIRRLNCYGLADRNITHYGQVVENNTLPAIFDTIAKTSNFHERMKEVVEFNGQSKTHLRGLSLSAVKFGISFTTTFLNQANSLVNVYLDGTVQVSTGATEMGQGVNTNIQQLVADEFGIEAKDVVVMATSTEKTNNASPTAASSATDLNGFAAVNACQKIKRNLCTSAIEHWKQLDPSWSPDEGKIVFQDKQVFDLSSLKNKLSFAELVGMAYRERRSLGEKGFYSTPKIHFDWSKGEGHPFLYYTNGAAVAEVEIDRFTGDLRIKRLDVLMDIGKQINPGINRGQIIGGLVQGIGWVTTEELRYSDKGALLSHSPTTYKIPNIHDLPDEFNVDVFENDSNTLNVRGTKAVGEPPLCLGLAVWTAAKHALSFVSRSELPQLALPATNEELLSRLSYYNRSYWKSHDRSRANGARVVHSTRSDALECDDDSEKGADREGGKKVTALT
jgi:xanthine dehydrogenase large subunit